jgi:PEP-CTERM motif
MKTLKYVSLMLLATIVMSVQAKGVASGMPFNESDNVAGSLAPSGYLNASGANSWLPDYLAAARPSSSVAGGIDSMVVNVVASGSIPNYGNPGQNFSAVAVNSVEHNNPVGAEPLVVPEPTTLALIGFGGLVALTFMRRLGKTNQA